MSTGYITLRVFSAGRAMPVPKAQVRIVDLRIALDQTITTDAYGNADKIKVYAPEKEISMNPQDTQPPYETYNIEVARDGYIPTIINNVPVFAGETSLQPVAMIPAPEGEQYASLVDNYDVPPGGLSIKGERFAGAGGEQHAVHMTRPVYIPETIRVHLGPPGSGDKTVRVPFADYVKNAASTEIYPTWPKQALNANILAIISFALNRIYTGYYPAKGYDYDITADPMSDPFYVDGRNVYVSVSDIVDEVFNEFIKRMGFAEPLLAAYCNGITARCEGLSQWGTLTLANQGKSAEEILKYYYGNVQTNESGDIRGIGKDYPGTPVRLGDVGENVMALQRALDEIGRTYTNIPDIPRINGNYDAYTQDAARAFQRQFNLSPDGIAGKKTWYQIQFVHAAYRKLEELSRQRAEITLPGSPPDTTLMEGDRGVNVRILKFLLFATSVFYSSVLPVAANNVFDAETTASVKSFQKTYALPETGTADPATWDALMNVYKGIDSQAGTVLDLILLPPGAGIETDTGAHTATPQLRPVQGARANTDLERVKTAMKMKDDSYPFDPMGGGRMGMRYSADIPDYMPVSASEEGTMRQGEEIDPFDPPAQYGPVARQYFEPEMQKDAGQSGGFDDMTGMTRPGTQFYPPAPMRMPGMPAGGMTGRGGGMTGETMPGPGAYAAPPGSAFGMRETAPPGGEPDTDAEGTAAYECPAPPRVSPPFPGRVLKIGSKEREVEMMQEFLSYIALSLMRYKKITNELKVIVNDGIYGIDTTDAVIRFQNRYEMPVNGVIDAPTWAKIVEVYNSPFE